MVSISIEYQRKKRPPTQALQLCPMFCIAHASPDCLLQAYPPRKLESTRLLAPAFKLSRAGIMWPADRLLTAAWRHQGVVQATLALQLTEPRHQQILCSSQSFNSCCKRNGPCSREPCPHSQVLCLSPAIKESLAAWGRGHFQARLSNRDWLSALLPASACLYGLRGFHIAHEV